MLNLDVLNSYPLDIEWVNASEIKGAIALANDLPKLSARQWSQAREESNLNLANINGKWQVSFLPVPEEITVDEPQPVVKPSVVTFGNLSHSLAVVQGTGTDISLNNPVISTLGLSEEVDLFRNQLSAFTEFLNSADQMLKEREADIRRKTQEKEQLLEQTRLQVLEIRTRAQQTKENAVKSSIQNETLNRELTEQVELGKSLHSQLSSLE